MKPTTALISLGFGSTLSMAAPTTVNAATIPEHFDTDVSQSNMFNGAHHIPEETFTKDFPEEAFPEGFPEETFIKDFPTPAEAERFAPAVGAKNLAGGPSHRARMMKRTDGDQAKCFNGGGPFANACYGTGYSSYGVNRPGWSTPYPSAGWNTPYGAHGWNTPYGAHRWNTPYGAHGWNIPYGSQNWNIPYSATAWNIPNGAQNWNTGFGTGYPPFGIHFNSREGPKPEQAKAAAH